jgi:hypothetical protein
MVCRVIRGRWVRRLNLDNLARPGGFILLLEHLKICILVVKNAAFACLYYSGLRKGMTGYGRD